MYSTIWILLFKKFVNFWRLFLIHCDKTAATAAAQNYIHNLWFAFSWCLFLLLPFVVLNVDGISMSLTIHKAGWLSDRRTSSPDDHTQQLWAFLPENRIVVRRIVVVVVVLKKTASLLFMRVKVNLNLNWKYINICSLYVMCGCCCCCCFLFILFKCLHLGHSKCCSKNTTKRCIWFSNQMN